MILTKLTSKNTRNFVIILTFCSIPVAVFTGVIGLLIMIPLTVIGQLAIDYQAKKLDDQHAQRSRS